MATVSYFFASWVDSGETGLLPGAQHFWQLTGFGYGDFVGVTVSALTSDAGPQQLMVKDVQSQTSGGTRRLLFTIQNTGSVRALGYGMNFAFVSA